ATEYSGQDKIPGIDPDQIIASQRVDLDGDGTIETIVITYEESLDGHPVGGNILVYTESDGELSLACTKEGLNPWKLEIGDVDGDDQMEIAVGVWKESPFDPVMAKRVFIYSWDGETLQKKWLGSRLSRRFDDFVLYDINDDGWDELIALEVGESGMHRVAVYRWDIFGFEWLGCSEEMADLSSFCEDEENLTVLTDSEQFGVEFHEDHVDIEPIELEENDVRL
ncbi:MAG: hypothetical protein NTY09_13285, partial [bacterium]|nr:hypothetical protein [bacterium]